MVAVSTETRLPPLPVLPLSLTVRVSVALAPGVSVVVDVAHRAGRVGVEQVVDLRHGAGDGHRRRAAVRHHRTAGPGGDGEGALGDGEGHGHRRRAGIGVADGEAVVLQADGGLLGRRVAHRRDGRHRRVVHGRDGDGGGVDGDEAAAAAGVAVVVDGQGQRGGGTGRVRRVDVAHRAGGIGVEQVVDLGDGAGDGHRRRAAVGHHGAAGAGGDGERALGDGQGHRHRDDPASASLMARPLFFRLTRTCSVAA